MKNCCKYFIVLISLFLQLKVVAQDNLYTSYTTADARVKLYRNLINNSINKNLSIPLNDSTEENWEEAFGALELLLYKNDWVNNKVQTAFDSIQFRSDHFKKMLLELAYTNYQTKFLVQVSELMQQTIDPKTFAMCAEYILQQKQDGTTLDDLEETIIKKFTDQSDNVFIMMLSQHINELKSKPKPFLQNKYFTQLLDKKFLPGQIVMYSFQRKDRNYPGIVVVRNAEGKFIRDSSGNIFNVPQLARSITDLPGYITNGNTPQGIFRMYGFEVSRSNFIGPSPNVQMAMPVEMKLQKFFNDSTIEDSVWSIEWYKKLLPKTLKDYQPLYNAYYAGLAGRTEIIAHGTTINPEYYKGQPYYPHTPSQGCLCTKEIWNGKRMESNQQKLITALLKAGGANGYCVVVELDDKEIPVTIEEILPHLLSAESLK